MIAKLEGSRKQFVMATIKWTLNWISFVENCFGVETKWDWKQNTAHKSFCRQILSIDIAITTGFKSRINSRDPCGIFVQLSQIKMWEWIEYSLGIWQEYQYIMADVPPTLIRFWFCIVWRITPYLLVYCIPVLMCSTWGVITFIAPLIWVRILGHALMLFTDDM